MHMLKSFNLKCSCILPCINIPLQRNFIVDLNNKNGKHALGSRRHFNFAMSKNMYCIHCELFEDKFTKGTSSTAMFESQKRVKRDSQ